MGCDIHLYTEKKIDGKWELAEKLTPNKYYDPETAAEDGEQPEDVSYDDAIYNGRNYNLFAMLADVRNGHGFAGIKTGDGFNVIAHPRGLPNDASSFVRNRSDRYGIDGHSHSHLTLRELLDFDWTQETTLQGLVDVKEWCRWRVSYGYPGTGPEQYCGDVSGASIKKLTPGEAAMTYAQTEPRFDGLRIPERIEALEKQFGEKYGELNDIYIHARWGMKYYQCAGEFIKETIPKLLKLAEGDYDSVRIVFFFDN